MEWWRRQPFVHPMCLVVLPGCACAAFTLFLGAELSDSSAMLIVALLSCGTIGAGLYKVNYPWIVAGPAAAAPVIVASWKHWYWAFDMPSPGGAAQTFVRWLGWSDAPMPAAVAIMTVTAGIAGWLLGWYKRE